MEVLKGGRGKMGIGTQTADVVIIGGGPAGLSAALVLGRSRRRVVIIDEGKPRNAVVSRSHGFLTRDGISPEQFREIARQELAKYKNVVIIDDAVADVWREDKIFKAILQKGDPVSCRKIVFATGVQDHLPPIPGLDDVYGTSVFPCPYCDGWERSDQPLAVFGNGDNLFGYIKLIFNWSNDLVVFSNGPAHLSSDERSAMSERLIKLIEEPIRELESINGHLSSVVLNNGDVIARKGGFLVDTGAKQATAIPSKLGVGFNKIGGYETMEHGKTNIEGVYMIGDAETMFSGLICAAGEGYEAGVFINHELVDEDWRRN